ncbi:TRAP transporter substrate-binding protein [Ferrovibrio sp.]|uniref:TRAP transporter substrate-binding protein n=1 Tax=Ferrovibrio sp. TaxID=1917215 RepID=UPI0035120144
MLEITSIRRMATLAATTVLLLGAAAASAAEVRIGLDSPADKQKSGSYVFAAAMADALKAAGWQVKEMPVNSIGGEAERLDQASQGLLEINMADLGQAGKLNKLIFGYRLPYLFESLAHLDRATKASSMLGKVNDGLKGKGIRVVALVPVGGGMGIFNTKRPVISPADVEGMRIRALDESQLQLFKAWGANGVVITMPEVANALQTGIADGYVNPPFVPFLFGHTDILKYYTTANVGLPLRIAMVSSDWYGGLKPAEKKAVDDAVAKGEAANRDWVKTSDAAAIDQLLKAGIKVDSLTAAGRARFEELSRSIYDTLLPPDQVKLFVDAAARAR